MVIRNIIGIVGASALYIALFYARMLFELGGRSVFLLLAIFHLGFGVAGYFIFTGSVTIRAVCVFLVIVTFGVIIELTNPDPGHAMAKVFVAIPFGVLAAVGAHGAAFATYGEAKSDNFHWLEGKEFLKSYLAPNGTNRKFCGNCGSSLIFVPSNDTGDIIEFALGTLDSEIELKPDAHIFTGYGANWHEITDDLPRFTEARRSND